MTLPPPDQLIDSGEVADILGLSRKSAVSEYRSRYADFPVPYVEKSAGKAILWLRADIEKWSATHRRQRGPEPGPKPSRK